MVVAFLRTVIVYLLLILSMRLMGKRQLGELQPIELVITIIISDLAAIPITDSGIPLIYGIIPLLTLVLCELIVSAANLKSLHFRRGVMGSPRILIENGRVLQREMKGLRYTLNDLLGEVRNSGCCQFSDVAFAVVETGGKLSVIPKESTAPAPAFLPRMIVNDGRIVDDELMACGADIKALNKAISAQKIKLADVFYCIYTGNNSFDIVKKERI